MMPIYRDSRVDESNEGSGVDAGRVSLLAFPRLWSGATQKL